MKGLITKGIAGFYYVKTEDGIFQCKARGIFKKEGITPFIGDYVDMDVTDEIDDEGIINEIMPRRNIFLRPPVSNIDVFVIVVALDNPEPNTEIVDKFLATAELSDVEAVVVINKEDLCGGDSGDSPALSERTKKLLQIYEPLYKTLAISAKEKTGLNELKHLMKGRKCALAGPSGVGKSAIINAIDERLDVETGHISRKTKRGKHTTRHVEIYETTFGAYVYDTPGFTSFEVENSEDVRLDYLFPDFEQYRSNCRFANCKHISEPGCAVREAVSDGKIAESRYASYLKIDAVDSN